MLPIFAQANPGATPDSVQVPDASAGERLAELVEQLQGAWGAAWLQEMGLLVVVVLLAWLPSRFLVRWLAGRRGDRSVEGRNLRLFREMLDALVWPALSLAVLAGLLQLGAYLYPGQFSGSLRVLPVLGFFLLFRVLSTLIKEFIPEGPHRRRLRRVFLPVVLVLAALQQLGLLGGLVQAMSKELFTLGAAPISLMSLLVSLFSFIVFVVLARVVGQLVARKFLPGLGLDRALSDAVGTVTRYVLVVLGLLVAIDSLGYDLTALKIAFGALGVGIGFGLQNIVNNFTSGLILLFERTVKRGDVLEAGGTHGRVMSIGLRSSVMRTREGDDIIVPNSHLVENQVTNYSLRDTLKRVDIDVGVSYGSDPKQVQEVLLTAADGVDHVRKSPPPSVLFTGFGDSSIDFQLRVWIDDAWLHPQVASAIRFRIWDALKGAGIEIPFPQRDLHIRSGELPIRRLGEGE